MDIILFGLFIIVALITIALDYWKKAPYMGVIGGITLVLLGIFLAVDGSLTIISCV